MCDRWARSRVLPTSRPRHVAVTVLPDPRTKYGLVVRRSSNRSTISGSVGGLSSPSRAPRGAREDFESLQAGFEGVQQIDLVEGCLPADDLGRARHYVGELASLESNVGGVVHDCLAVIDHEPRRAREPPVVPNLLLEDAGEGAEGGPR